MRACPLTFLEIIEISLKPQKLGTMKRTTHLMKRTLAMLFLMTACMYGWAASFTVDGISYNITDSKGLVVEVTSSNPKYQGRVIIPATVTYDEKTYSVKAIGQYAFQKCTDLTAVFIGPNVEVIGYAAFSGCTSLAEINWSNNIKQLDTNAFMDCTALTSVELSSNLAKMNSGVFSGCINITSATINEGCAIIGVRAFTGCKKLATISIPNSVTAIESSAFSYCTALTTASIGNGVKTIDDYAFKDCTSLASIHIGTAVETIGYAAFNNCTSLAEINWSNNIRKLETNAFTDCTALTYAELSSNLEEMGSGVFSGCINITSATINEGCAVVGIRAFTGCKKLATISIPNSVTSLGSSAFSYCTALTTASIGDGVKSVGDYAFQSCTKLATLKIGSNVSNVGYSAFNDCSALRSISVYNKEVPATGTTAFTSFNATLHVPVGTVDDYKAHSMWGKFGNVEAMAETYYLTIKQAEGGYLKIATAGGYNYTFVIQAEEGWKVNSLTYNGNDVTTQIVDGTFTTPAITADAILSVSFEQGSNAVHVIDMNDTKVYSAGNHIVIKGVDSGEIIQVYSLDGKLENSFVADSEEIQIKAQTGKAYIVKTAHKTVKLSL